MKRLMRRILFVVAMVCFGQPMVVASAEDDEMAVQGPDIEDLGDERYRIGSIRIDRTAGEFSLGGKILHLAQPLEYLAAKTDGAKAYESLLELNTSAAEFQLACILVGLDDAGSVKPEYQFHEREVKGQAVVLSISWEVDGETVSVAASDALTGTDDAFDDSDWVYIGSFLSPQDGSLMAESAGTLIGFVHDPYSIIEHRKGVTAGSYGMITGNADVLPPEGSEVTLTVSVVTE